MDKELIKSRLDNLYVVKTKLKEKFIGIDNVIDNFIDSVKIWYAAPELQLRPLIVNLWGMTGVGKTDLIRTFVKLINFNNKFIELQMDNLDSKIKYGPKSIQYNLEMVLDDTNESGILLLDEMQRFKTVDEFGRDLPKDETDKFSDIWSLLSDGKFSNNSNIKDEMNDLFYEILTSIQEEKESKPQNESVDKIEGNHVSKKYPIYYWRAKRIKKLLSLSDSILDIMKWDYDFLLNKISLALNNNDSYEGNFYSKLLIIISGNLDEAYSMASNTNEIDIDADIYHEFSKSINLIDIKKALTTRFKPEQIARFGNNHIIYTSLNKDTYKKIIKLKCDEIIKHIFDKTTVSVSFSDSVLETIYRNGVFPTQGVRPVLSTISSIIENNIPFFIYNSLNNNVKNITINLEYNYLTSKIGDEIYKTKILTTVDNIKKIKNSEKECVVAVHEVGHAITYMNLFNIIPLQLICNTASSDNDGFLIPHTMELSKRYIKNNIIVALAGQCAEEIIFGDGQKTTGCGADLRTATDYASNYIRRYGMDGYTGNIITTSNNENLNYGVIDKSDTSELIHNLLKECKTDATNIINNNLTLLKKLTIELLNNKKLEDEQIFDIVKEFYPNIRNEKTSFTVIENYIEIMNKKFEQIK